MREDRQLRWKAQHDFRSSSAHRVHHGSRRAPRANGRQRIGCGKREPRILFLVFSLEMRIQMRARSH